MSSCLHISIIIYYNIRDFGKKKLSSIQNFNLPRPIVAYHTPGSYIKKKITSKLSEDDSTQLELA